MRRRKSRQCCSDVGNRLGSTRAANAAERNKCSGLQRRQRRGHLEEACGSQLLQHVVGGLAAAAAGAGHLAEALGRQLSVGVKPARAAGEWQAGLGRVEAHPVAFACSSHTPQPRPPQTPPPPPPRSHVGLAALAKEALVEAVVGDLLGALLSGVCIRALALEGDGRLAAVVVGLHGHPLAALACRRAGGGCGQEGGEGARRRGEGWQSRCGTEGAV